MTEIFVNNILIDTKEDFPISLNYAIADILNPDKRNTSYSKTIKLPGTKTNNSLFSHIFDISKEVQSNNSIINFTPDFNPNLKANVKIFEDNILQFTGVMQLIQINMIDGHYEYETSVFGQLKNIMLAIDGKKLEDLDLSEYNHDFTRARMKESWDTKIQKDGVDYVNFAAGLPTGEGYVYPTIDYGYTQSPTKLNIKNSYPAVYAREYMAKIFEYAGFRWTSNFLDSDFYKSLIVPFNKSNALLTEEEALNRSFKAVIDSDVVAYSGGNAPNSQTFQKPFIICFPNDSTGDGFDNTNQYTPGTGIALYENGESSFVYSTSRGVYLNKKKGTYDFVVDINLRVDFEATVGGAPIAAGFSRLEVKIVKGNTNTNTKSTIASTGSIDRSNTTFNEFNGTLTAPNIFLGKNDYVYTTVYFSQSTNGSIPIQIAKFTTAAGSGFYNRPVSVPILVGDLMYLNSAIPKDVLMKDYFLSTIKMFNLYVQPDPVDDGNLLIEPLVDFYAGNSVIDWTDKVDTSKEMLIKPCSAIEGKNYKFRFKPDNDFYNADYRDRYESEYGEKNIDIINDFVNGEKLFELSFSPTPSYGVTTNSMVIPRIVSLDPETGGVTPYDSNVRILQYGGVKDAGGVWKWQDIASLTSFNETTYAYAGHLDDPFNPTFDLLFDKPKSIYWGAPSNIGANYTNNNLYNKYYSQFIAEITDRNSKIITLSIRLRPIDMFNLSFENFIHIDGQNYRLNKISDYNPSVDGTCKVELLKIKAGSTFVPFDEELDDGTANDPTKFDILEGGLNEVRSMSAITNVDLVDGGLNAVINLGSINTINLVNGGTD